MPEAGRILREALSQIKPDPTIRKTMLNLAKKTLRLTNSVARKYKAKAILVGSLTRDTWLPDKKEFDVFVLFPEKLKDKKMEELGLKIGKTVIEKLKGTYVVEYAEHPYTSGTIGGISVDIVPCFAVKSAEKIKSAVDRTPFHVQFIEKNLPLRLSGEVRLLKQFLKNNDMYGADAKTEGYSGYVCELLIINYKKFMNVLKAAAKWKPGEIIDLREAYKKADYEKLWKTFKDQPLILIDPTDRNRNTAAALSAFNFYKFIKHAKMFASKPNKEYFLSKKLDPITETELIQLQIKRRTELIIIKFLPPRVVPDILWPQLRRFADRLQSILEETQYEFKVLSKDLFTDGEYIATVLLEMEVSKLPSVQKRVGPSIFDAKDANNFLKKYKDQALAGPYVEGKNWVVEINRDFLTARDELHHSLSQPLDILKAKGIPNFIAERLVKGFEIFSESERIMQVVERNKDFGIFLRKYFEKEKFV